MTWVEVATIIGGLITAVGGAQGIRALVRRRPRPRPADAAVALSAGTIRWAEALEATAQRASERAEAAEVKADEADRRADEAVRQATRAEIQLDRIVSYLDQLLSVIFEEGVDPATHVRRIRAVAARPPAPIQSPGGQHEQNS